MTSTPSYNRQYNIIVIGMIAFINALFLLKYLARYISHAEVYTILYVVLLGAAYWFWESKKFNISPKVILVLASLFAIAFVVVLKIIPAAKLNVDRWSVIYSFWQTMFQGQYPYSAQSHMGNFPGPLPIYFIVALPFYLVKEIGFMPLLAALGFILYTLQKSKNENSNYSFAILLLLTSPCIYWEIVARSTIFFFSLLLLIYAEWVLNKGLLEKKDIYLGGLFGGLLLSTRFIYAVLFCIWAIYMWRQGKSLTKIIGWGTITTVVFAATILPLWLIFPAEFAQYNPFKTESSSFVPFTYNFIFMAIAIICGFLCKNKQSTLFFSGMALFLIILLYLGFHIYRDGWDNTLTNSYADISYFILPLPFLLASLRLEPKPAFG